MPAGAKAPPSIAVRSEPTKGFDAKLEKSRTLMGGTEAMRLAAKKYLPQFEGETKAHYDYRRSISYLFNGFRKTVWDFSGRVFEQPTVLSEETEEVFKDWSEDIDMEGRDLSTFAKQVFEAGVQSGIEYLLVDAPPKNEDETVAQAQANNNRPYIVHIRPENVLGWKTGRIANKTVLTMFRFKEWIEVEKDEFSSERVEQIKVFDLQEGQTVRVRSFIQNKKTGDWEQQGDDMFTGLDVITVTPFYANRTDFFKGEPPLEDLSDLNIAHWQSQSDQRNILHFARVPILFGKGLSENAKLKVSASSVTKATSPEADLKFVEHSGAAISSGQKDLEHLEFQMQTMGLQFIVNDKGAQTATGETRNEKKETSRLAAMADSLQDALEKCFQWMAEYDSKEFKGAVKVFKDFAAGSISANVLHFLINAVMHGKLSKKTFWAEMKRYGLLAEDFDPELEEAMIEADQPEVDGLTGLEGPDDEDDDEPVEE